MYRRFYLLKLFILFYIAFRSLNAQASVFEPPPHSKIPADSIIAAIDRGEAVWINNCEIFGPLIKRGTPERPDTIRGPINILYSTIYDSVSFSYCYFTSYAVFSVATFKGVVDFSYVTFSKDAPFLACTFKKPVRFQVSTFCRNAYFAFTEFAEDAIFLHTTFREQVDFSQIEFKDIYISWKQLEDHLIYDTRFNLKLMKHFEEKRQLDDADGIYLFMKDHERIKKPRYMRYLEYWLIHQTCGYGVKPLNTLILSILIIILFAFFYTKPNAIKEIEKQFGLRSCPRSYRDISKRWRERFYYALYFSLHTFIIGVVSDWHPTDEFLIGSSKKRGVKLFKFRTLSMIEGALGWILVILFIISLGKKFIR